MIINDKESAEIDKRISILEVEIKNFKSYLDTKLNYIIDYFKNVNALYEKQTEEMVILKSRCTQRFSDCIEKLGNNKTYSLERNNKTLFQILIIILTFVSGIVSGLIITIFTKKNG